MGEIKKSYIKNMIIGTSCLAMGLLVGGAASAPAALTENDKYSGWSRTDVGGSHWLIAKHFAGYLSLGCEPKQSHAHQIIIRYASKKYPNIFGVVKLENHRTVGRSVPRFLHIGLGSLPGFVGARLTERPDHLVQIDSAGDVLRAAYYMSKPQSFVSAFWQVLPEGEAAINGDDNPIFLPTVSIGSVESIYEVCTGAAALLSP